MKILPSTLILLKFGIWNLNFKIPVLHWFKIANEGFKDLMCDWIPLSLL